MHSIAILLLMFGLHSGGEKLVATASRPCWERDAFPILKRNCLACHGQGSAMGNLSTPDSAHSHSKMIQQNLSSGKMPMRGQLSGDDRNTLVSWAAQGAVRCP